MKAKRRKPVSFTVTSKESDLIAAIARRALVAAAKAGAPIQTRDMPAHVELEMDITAVHANGCPLDLSRLLSADDFNFGHDVFGIRRYLNRDDGSLTNHFVPRFATSERP